MECGGLDTRIGGREGSGGSLGEWRLIELESVLGLVKSRRR